MKLVRLSAGAAAVLAASLLTAQGVQAADHSTRSQLRDATPCPNKLISAHEGFRKNYDGDTIDSQNAAFRIGANIADTDVWVTADSYQVEIHDADVSHSTDGTGLITDMTIDQWSLLRTTQHHEPIPTLEETLALPQLQQPGRFVMIETKYSYQKPGRIEALVAAIQAAGVQTHVIIYSDYLSQVQKVNALDPSIITWAKPLDYAPPPSDVPGVDGIMLPASLLTADITAQYHAIGYTVIRQRTAESLTNWQAFLATGADGLMTDSPQLMIKRCRELG